MDENERCKEYIDCFFSDEDFPGGLMFKDHLAHAKLDYSLESLGRIDLMLKTIRNYRHASYKQFVSSQSTLNFILLVAYYMGCTIARIGMLSMKWMTYDEAMPYLKNKDRLFENSRCCVIAGRFYFPLGVITEIIFSTSPERTIRSYAEWVISDNPASMKKIPRTYAIEKDQAKKSEFDKNWNKAVRHAGFCAAWAMAEMAEGGKIYHTLYYPSPDKESKGVFKSLMGYESSDQALKVGSAAMENNPESVEIQLFYYDAYANLPTGRIDSLFIDIRCYRKLFSLRPRKPLSVQLAVPYRNHDRPGGFRIYTPLVIDGQPPREFDDILFREFNLGINTFNSEKFNWDAYLDEGV